MELDRATLPESLHAYTRRAWDVVEPGKHFIDGWYLEAMCEHLEACLTGQIRNLLITMPPRHYKSGTVSIMFPTWGWVKNPRYRFLYTSYGLNLSIRDALASRRLIQSEWYQDRWGEDFYITSDQNAKVRYDNNFAGVRIASSVGGIGTGEGGDFIVVDDPHNVLDVESDVKRQEALDWWDGTMSSRLNDPKTGVRIIVMQRTHVSDLAGHVLKQGGYVHLSLPAEYDMKKRTTVIGWSDPRKRKGELLCPERFGKAELDELKVRLGPYRAPAQLQQTPTPAEGAIFKKRWFKLYGSQHPLPQFQFIIQSYDTAFTDKTQNDPTACTVWGVFKYKKANHIMLLEAWQDYLTYPDLRKRVKLDRRAKYGEEINEHGVDLILIEAKGSGITLIQDLGSIGVAAWPYNPHKADKIARAHSVTPVVAAGFVWLMESAVNEGHPVQWAQECFDEVIQFGPGASADNFVDTMTQALLWCKNNEMLEAKVITEEGEDIDEEETKYRKPVPNPYSQ